MLAKYEMYLGGRLGRSCFKRHGDVNPGRCFVKMPKLSQVPGKLMELCKLRTFHPASCRKKIMATSSIRYLKLTFVFVDKTPSFQSYISLFG